MESSTRNVISLMDRELGYCPACAAPVRFADDFIRVHRHFVHVVCAMERDPGNQPGFPRPAPPDPGA